MPVPSSTGSFKTNILNMAIGDYIAFKYAASSGAAGTFSDFGAALATAQASEIPVTGAAAPNGYAYALKVAPGLLITDRVLQNSVSYNTLNAAKFIQGLKATLNSNDVLIRSITCGVAYMGADGLPKLTDAGLGAWPACNEWDKYIAGANLGGKITAGDDAVWHWKKYDLSTICQDTPVNGFSYTFEGDSTTYTNRDSSGRIYRPSSSVDVKKMGWGAFSNALNIGFRPVFEFLENDSKSSNLWY